MIVLYIASALIMIRSIVRVAQYLQGNNGYLLRREIFLYIFDALLMLFVMVLFNCVHPAEITDLYQERLSRRSLYSGDDTARRFSRSGYDDKVMRHSRRW